MIFVTVKCCVFFAVRAESLKKYLDATSALGWLSVLFQFYRYREKFLADVQTTLPTHWTNSITLDTEHAKSPTTSWTCNGIAVYFFDVSCYCAHPTSSDSSTVHCSTIPRDRPCIFLRIYFLSITQSFQLYGFLFNFLIQFHICYVPTATFLRPYQMLSAKYVVYEK
jgi:hypothetical protein